jgi:hypothetical protein
MDGFAQMEADILKFFGFDEETVFEQEEHESYEYFTPVTTGPIIPGSYSLTHSLTYSFANWCTNFFVYSGSNNVSVYAHYDFPG